jgi:hypothetical protein
MHCLLNEQQLLQGGTEATSSESTRPAAAAEPAQAQSRDGEYMYSIGCEVQLGSQLTMGTIDTLLHPTNKPITATSQQKGLEGSSSNWKVV